MASWTDFFIVVSGDKRHLQELKEFLRLGIESVQEFRSIEISKLFPDLDSTSEHEFLLLSDLSWLLEDSREELEITGESKWTPPGPFVERLSLKFPDLVFEFGGTTEHEFYERWVCKKGISAILDARTDDIRNETSVWHVRDGVKQR